MVSEGALAVNPTNPSGPFSGSHPQLTSLVFPSPPVSLPMNRLFLFTTLIPGEQRLLIPTCDLRGWSCRPEGNTSPASRAGTRMLSWSPPGAHVTWVQL